MPDTPVDWALRVYWGQFLVSILIVLWKTHA